MTNTNSGDSDLGCKRLRRLETFLDVVYAVLFVHFIMYLPTTEDMAWHALPFGLFSLLLDNWIELLRLFIAVGLTLTCWNLTHKLFGPLERTNGTHTLLALLQLFCVCLFLFFAIADPALKGLSSPVGQSLCLAISGFVGIAGWRYARNHGLVKAEWTEKQQTEVSNSIIIEPTTALLNTGVAFIGPVAWTLGWIAIPLVLMGVRRLLNRRR